MKPLEELLNDNVYAFASIRRAKSDVEINGLHAIYFWWENSRLVLYFHINHEPNRDEIDDISSIVGETSCDFDIDLVDGTWGKDQPEERAGMVKWIIDPQ